MCEPIGEIAAPLSYHQAALARENAQWGILRNLIGLCPSRSPFILTIERVIQYPGKLRLRVPIEKMLQHRSILCVRNVCRLVQSIIFSLCHAMQKQCHREVPILPQKQWHWGSDPDGGGATISQNVVCTSVRGFLTTG